MQLLLLLAAGLPQGDLVEIDEAALGADNLPSPYETAAEADS